MAFYIKPGEGNPIEIEGLPFYGEEHLFRRLRLNPPQKLADDVEKLTWNTAGAKFRFRARAKWISIKAELTERPWTWHGNGGSPYAAGARRAAGRRIIRILRDCFGTIRN